MCSVGECVRKKEGTRRWIRLELFTQGFVPIYIIHESYQFAHWQK